MGKTALITGASKRIGKFISEFLASKGWSIIIHYNTSGKDAQELAGKLSQQYTGQYFTYVGADLSDITQVEKLISGITSKHGEFELLINNASVFDRSYLKETSVSLFERQLSVNLRAPFFLIRDFAKYCKTGNVINLVDTRVTSNKSNFSAYSISKKALWELTKLAALEFAPDIRVNAIAPGLTLPPHEEKDDYLLKLAENIPMKKPVGVDPILKSVDYIIENKILTGQLLFADGGENLGMNV
jgi:NAD(P)-dependent dehydrogenase (short-subunit alcohol dehydrogenase family)